MNMPSVLITGCDTGLGREFASQYARDGYTVYATYRDLANRLPDTTAGTIRHFALDVGEHAQFDALKRELGDSAIDVLVSNAGIGLETAQFGNIDFDYMQRMYKVNTVGPLKLVQTFADNVAASEQKRILIVSSRMGSIASNLSGGHYGYRASKAALNAVGRSLAVDLIRRGITVHMLHPGRVNTAGGGGADAPITPEESVAAMRAIVVRSSGHETGYFASFNGQQLPW